MMATVEESSWVFRRLTMFWSISISLPYTRSECSRSAVDWLANWAGTPPCGTVTLSRTGRDAARFGWALATPISTGEGVAEPARAAESGPAFDCVALPGGTA